MKLDSGARVRLMRGTIGPEVASLVAVSRDTLVARWADGATTAIPLASVTRLDVSRGMVRHPWRGAGIGLLIGAGTGAAIGAATYSTSGCEQSTSICLDFGPGLPALFGGVVLGGVGSVLGFASGMRRRERWHRVPLDRPRVNLTIAPARRGVAVALRY